MKQIEIKFNTFQKSENLPIDVFPCIPLCSLYSMAEQEGIHYKTV